MKKLLLVIIAVFMLGIVSPAQQPEKEEPLKMEQWMVDRKVWRQYKKDTRKIYRHYRKHKKLPKDVDMSKYRKPYHKSIPKKEN